MAKKLFKKGMSPLIATVLLIALAVSIGTTIINLGGLYYGKMNSDSKCSKAMINAFELEKTRQCGNLESEFILNFYPVDSPMKVDECYKEIATGKADICTSSNDILNFTWVPAKDMG